MFQPHRVSRLKDLRKEFSLSLSTLRKKAANEGWYKKENNIKMLEKNMNCVNNLKESIQN